MNKNRLEAFSDGVLAIIITIMVLEIKVPHDSKWSSLGQLLPVFMSYIISFLLVGIYWGNHHNLIQAAKKVNSAILLSNLHLLFWLSLLPFATAWMGENKFQVNTTTLYAAVLICCGFSYWILQRSILKSLAPDDPFHKAVSKQKFKMLTSMLSTFIAIPMAYVNPYLAGFLFILQSAIWVVPDKNIERTISNQQDKD
jgi:uncharacterized membrane protein